MRIAADGCLEGWIRSKMIAVVGILVAAADLVGALAKQFGRFMGNMGLAAVILNGRYQCIDQANLPVDFLQVQYAAIGADAWLINRAVIFLPFRGVNSS